jgi:uncharacterized protein YciI
MLFALIGFLKDEKARIDPSVQVQTVDFLGQPFIKIQFAGRLRDESGEEAGMMMIFEHETREAAETFLKESPYVQAGLFQSYQLYEYLSEVG